MKGRSERRHDPERRRNNVALITAKTVTLDCGHITDQQPLAQHPDGRAFYACPQGCSGLQTGRRTR